MFYPSYLAVQGSQFTNVLSVKMIIGSNPVKFSTAKVLCLMVCTLLVINIMTDLAKQCNDRTIDKRLNIIIIAEHESVSNLLCMQPNYFSFIFGHSYNVTQNEKAMLM